MGLIPWCLGSRGARLGRRRLRRMLCGWIPSGRWFQSARSRQACRNGNWFHWVFRLDNPHRGWLIQQSLSTTVRLFHNRTVVLLGRWCWVYRFVLRGLFYFKLMLWGRLREYVFDRGLWETASSSFSFFLSFLYIGWFYLCFLDTFIYLFTMEYR